MLAPAAQLSDFLVMLPPSLAQFDTIPTRIAGDSAMSFAHIWLSTHSCSLRSLTRAFEEPFLPSSVQSLSVRPISGNLANIFARCHRGLCSPFVFVCFVHLAVYLVV